jgi:hypothetical protein
VAGGSGSGKTHLLQQCLPDFGIPFHIIDASGLVPAGIKGMTLKESLDGFFSSNTPCGRKDVASEMLRIGGDWMQSNEDVYRRV